MYFPESSVQIRDHKVSPDCREILLTFYGICKRRAMEYGSAYNGKPSTKVRCPLVARLVRAVSSLLIFD
jgi:hypothetical protein